MMKIRLAAYRLLCSAESLLHRLQGSTSKRREEEFAEPLRGTLARAARHGGARTLLVYAPTVGEINSVKPVITEYMRRWPHDRLAILTCYEQYLDLLARMFPDAVIGCPGFRAPKLVDAFMDTLRPRLFVISEGPALHGHFPQRLEVVLPAACLARKVPVVVTNAMYFEKQLSSRVDRLENALFAPLFEQAIRHWFPPYPEFERALRRSGVPADRMSIVGDLRFDSLDVAGSPMQPDLESLLAAYRALSVPVFVAGSVNDPDEQQLVVNAWLNLRRSFPDAKLVIALRYVNDENTRTAMRSLLEAGGTTFAFRSQWPGNAGVPEALVMDVFGELRHFYAIASASYIGRNHGVLEPLGHDSPTIVGPGWRTNYSAFPLYDYMSRHGAIIQVDDATTLTAMLLALVADPARRVATLAKAHALLSVNRGAASRIVEKLAPLLS